MTGRVAALSRFLPISARKCLPLFKALHNKEEFVWDGMCETAFQELKQTLAHPPFLTRPDPGKPLIVYLSITHEVVSAVLVKEVDKVQMPVYFISKALQGPELKY